MSLKTKFLFYDFVLTKIFLSLMWDVIGCEHHRFGTLFLSQICYILQVDGKLYKIVINLWEAFYFEILSVYRMETHLSGTLKI